MWVFLSPLWIALRCRAPLDRWISMRFHHPRFALSSPFKSFQWLGTFFGALIPRMVVLLFPTFLLAGAALRQPQGDTIMLWGGACFQGAICVLSLLSTRN